MPELTDDGRYLVVDGRRWRASDPSIPPKLRQELVDELMAARRAVRVDEEGARPRVQAAKVALGERGAPWWEEPSSEVLATRIEATMRTLVAHRAPDRTICPSDVARVVGGDGWRAVMDDVRDVARRLAKAGDVVITQKGVTLDPDRDWKGPVRIGTGGRPARP